MSKIITAPAPLPQVFAWPSVFLAGSIDCGKADNWQERFLSAFEREDVVLLNPRRTTWPSEADDGFDLQVNWELEALERCDMIAMYLTAESKAPVSLMEFGLWARSGKLKIACEKGFWRRRNLEITCERYGIPLHKNMDQLVRSVRGHLNTTRIGQNRMWTGKFLALIKEGHWEYAHRTNASGAAIIAAITENREVLLVEQYRIPVHARTIELPAGIIGDEPSKPDEAHAEAARRELLEETGYDAGKIVALTHGPSSGGLASETVTLFLATELKRTGPGGGVAHEDIMVHAVPLAKIVEWLEAKAKSGVLVDPKVYAGLFFIRRKVSG